MKLKTHIILYTAAIVMVACGSSRKALVQPTVIVDSKPATEATVSRTLSQSDTLAADTLPDSYLTDDTLSEDSDYADTTFNDSIALVRATASWKHDVRSGIDDILDDPLLQSSVCGIEVWDLDDDISLYRHSEQQRLRPASTMKVMTAITALNQLTSDYQFTTRVYIYPPLTPQTPTSSVDSLLFKEGRGGSLFLVGGMNPSISQSDIATLARAIRQQGIDSIKGTIYADQSFKDSKKWGSGWCWDDNDNPLLLPLKYRGKDAFVEEFIHQLRNEGIYVDGSQGTKETPAGAQLITTVSRSLRSVMRPMLKNSNNNCAESVFYAMIHSKYGNGATAHQGQTMIRNLMREAGVDNASSYDFVDGSGLSLYDYVSPHAEVMMLRYAWQHRNIYKTLYPLLPVAGHDGTLRKRMGGTRASGNVHAKTGTVTGIRSLCGFVTAPNGHHLAFSIMNQGVNGDDGTARQARAMQDKICELLASEN